MMVVVTPLQRETNNKADKSHTRSYENATKEGMWR